MRAIVAAVVGLALAIEFREIQALEMRATDAGPFRYAIQQAKKCQRYRCP